MYEPKEELDPCCDTRLLEKIHPMLKEAATSLAKSHGLTPQTNALKIKLSEAFVAIANAVVPGSKILPAPQAIQNAVRVANRVVSFILDGTTHYGTGILVGKNQVMTAAHLFFKSDGHLIDPTRLARTKVEVDTTLLGDIMFKSDPEYAELDLRNDPDKCFIEPPVSGGVARREVKLRDFAIVRINKAFGDDPIGANESRQWFHLPTAAGAPTLSGGTPVRAFQYVDHVLRLSSGFIREYPTVWRAAHTASTLDGSSGGPLVDDNGVLLAMHVSGSMCGVVPASNYAIPIAAIAAVIDADECGTSARERLLAS
jgi:hypothetical protein